MEPWPDQWSFLSSVARMSPGAVSELARSLRPVDAGPLLSLEELARRGGPPPPPVIRARLGAMLSIERAGLPPAVVAAFKHLGSIANPEFYEKQREQWRTRLAEQLGLSPTEIGQIGGGKDKPSGVVDVAMLQSLARRDDPAMFDRYGLVVVDECHHLPAVSFAACVQRARTRRWLGLTATPYRRDKLEALIGFHCGPTRHEIKPGAVAGAELVRRELVVHQTTTEVNDDDAAHIQSVFAALVADAERTRQICADVHAAVATGRTCLVLTQRTDHIEVIVDGLAALGDSPLVLRGGLGKKARAAVGDAIRAREPDAGIVLVATGSYLGEGFDWPELDVLFLAFPLAFKGRVVQYVGRLLRTHEGKHHVELHDYVDARIAVLDRMHTKRLPAYASLGFNVPNARRRAAPPTPHPGDPNDPF